MDRAGYQELKKKKTELDNMTVLAQLAAANPTNQNLANLAIDQILVQPAMRDQEQTIDPEADLKSMLFARLTDEEEVPYGALEAFADGGSLKDIMGKINGTGGNSQVKQQMAAVSDTYRKSGREDLATMVEQLDDDSFLAFQEQLEQVKNQEMEKLGKTKFGRKVLKDMEKKKMNSDPVSGMLTQLINGQ